MAFFRDLSPFRGYVPTRGLPNPLSVGWLSLLWYCPVGRTSAEFRRKLFRLCAHPYLKSRGYHTCVLGLCKFSPKLFGIAVSLNGAALSLGSSIIAVPGDDATYVAPDLIYHYVTRHWYRPPRVFIDAVLASPRE